MAKIPQGILGGVSGKVGGVVGSSWKGINVIKTKPLSVANPRTTGQVAQRTKFSNVVNFASLALASVVKPNWDRFASRESGYNAFIRENIEEFENPVPTNPENVLITKGVMEKQDFTIAAMRDGDTKIDITWVSSSGPKFKSGNDLSNEIDMVKDTGIIQANPTSVTRDTEAMSIPLAEPVRLGETVGVWLSFRRPDGTVVSDSTYKEIVVTA